MKDNQNDLMEEIANTVNLALKVQELYIKKGPFPELSLTEMHVIEAVSKEEFPTMSHVAHRLKVTVGTLTTNVKSIIKKGFLTKSQYQKDKRYTVLTITKKGQEALKVHEEYHHRVSDFYSELIPEEEYHWVYDTFEKVEKGLKELNKELSAK